MPKNTDWKREGRAWPKWLDRTLGNPADICRCGHTRDYHGMIMGVNGRGRCNQCSRSVHEDGCPKFIKATAGWRRKQIAKIAARHAALAKLTPMDRKALGLRERKIVSVTAEILDPVGNPSEVRRQLLSGRIGVATVRQHKRKYWELRFPQIGNRRGPRFYRRGDTEAYRFAVKKSREYKEFGALAASLTHAQRIHAAECFKKLEPLGVTLVDVVADYERRHPLGGRGRTYDQVVVELIAKKKTGKRCGTYVQDLEYKLKMLGKSFPPACHIATPNLEHIEKFLAAHKWEPGTQHSYVQGYKVLFNFAVKMGYRTDNPCQKLDLPRIVRKEPVIFTVEQARKAMDLTLTTPELRECLPYVALGTFAGIRPQEIERLRWDQISLESKTITVLASNSKTRSRRVVDISPNLAAWLLLIEDRTELVVPWLVKVGRLRMRAAMGFARWGHDIMRHSFGSYHFAKHRDEMGTVFQMGHGRKSDVFFSHYRALVQPAAADAFWEIYP